MEPPNDSGGPHEGASAPTRGEGVEDSGSGARADMLPQDNRTVVEERAEAAATTPRSLSHGQPSPAHVDASPQAASPGSSTGAGDHSALAGLEGYASSSPSAESLRANSRGEEDNSSLPVSPLAVTPSDAPEDSSPRSNPAVDAEPSPPAEASGALTNTSSEPETEAVSNVSPTPPFVVVHERGGEGAHGSHASDADETHTPAAHTHTSPVVDSASSEKAQHLAVASRGDRFADTHTAEHTPMAELGPSTPMPLSTTITTNTTSTTPTTRGTVTMTALSGTPTPSGHGDGLAGIVRFGDPTAMPADSMAMGPALSEASTPPGNGGGLPDTVGFANQATSPADAVALAALSVTTSHSGDGHTGIAAVSAIAGGGVYSADTPTDAASPSALSDSPELSAGVVTEGVMAPGVAGSEPPTVQGDSEPVLSGTPTITAPSGDVVTDIVAPASTGVLDSSAAPKATVQPPSDISAPSGDVVKEAPSASVGGVDSSAAPTASAGAPALYTATTAGTARSTSSVGSEGVLVIGGLMLQRFAL